MASLGHRLRRLREQRHLTQAELASSSGVGADVISRLENAHYPSPGLRTLLKVSEGLEVPLVNLFKEEETQAPPRENPNRERLKELASRLDDEGIELAIGLLSVLVRRPSSS